MTLYIAGFKLNVMKYVKHLDHKIANRHCGPQSEKVICKWRKYAGCLVKLEKNSLFW
jgi:hypothetical protein